ncbi:PDR/VanB family oxidoreductase [Amycolatopsis sp. FDAARGOS 1241]|uniref:PDR/VanB family oxidoreductase n=1 Tax=Amycolatopsis sp. FDAARGOS 1241 TaxID=2778070 RepID=UPI00194E29EA|nr:PDR/VanB family oxidoreductase [Amycolatopsis sp. FDAARGOS 1241]QRP47352.1 oxidoreductase [Amycolatopsis sp. FDAARGOS 1241]
MTDLRVVSLTWEADGVLSVVFADPSGAPVPAWTPGAHVDVEVGGLRRSYSLCGDPADDRVLKIAVLHEPAGRGGSEFVHTRLRPGDLVPVSAPVNNFELVDAPSYVFIAGGIGITPVLPMLTAVTARRAQWRLVYGGRRRTSMAFLDALARFGAAVAVRPEDEFGLLDLDEALKETTSDTVVYCCGPEPLLVAVEERCREHDRQLRVERFAAKPVESSLPANAFEVVCARSGVTATVGPDQSVLSALEDAGLPVLYSCQDGICGTCETTVLEGALDHRDSVLTDAERQAGDTMFICVSRCTSPRLVLDL